MKVIIKGNISKLVTIFLVFLLATVYLWYALPEMNTISRLVIVIIAIILILILGNNLYNCKGN